MVQYDWCCTYFFFLFVKNIEAEELNLPIRES